MSESGVLWILEKWRKTSIPQWRRILQEALDGGDKGREDYARWMLGEVLGDAEFGEDQA